MYTIIATGGKQYKAKIGDKLRIEKIEGEVGSAVTFNDVLLVSNGGEITVGNPYVDGVSVEGEITDQGKAKKVIVFKYKPKKGERKKNGHRQLFTEVEIKNVSGIDIVEDEEPEEEPEKAEKKASAKNSKKKQSKAEEVSDEAVKEAEGGEQAAEETEAAETAEADDKTDGEAPAASEEDEEQPAEPSETETAADDNAETEEE